MKKFKTLERLRNLRRNTTADMVIQALIVLSAISFCIETLPGLSELTRRSLKAFEYFCILVFTVEYVVRLLHAKPWTKYAFSFFGMIDALALIPFFLFLGKVDVRFVRTVRVLRLMRLLKLLHLGDAVDRLKQAFRDVKGELIAFSFVAVVVVFIAACGIHMFESKGTGKQAENFETIFDCLWWSIVTLTTVGYGDGYPETVGGKIFTSIILIVGIGIVAIPTGLVTSSLTARRAESAGESD